MGFQKYARNSIIVGAYQVSNGGGYYGTLGTLASEDYIVKLADGTITTKDQATFEAMYSATSGGSTLTGSTTYWD